MEKILIEKRAKELETLFNEIRRRGMGAMKIGSLKNAERHSLWLLASLAKENGLVKPSDVAKKLGVTMPAVSHQINALEELGLIERVTSQEDRREVLLTITPTGKEKIKEIKKQYWQKLCSLVEFLGEEDTKNLSNIITKLSKFTAENSNETNC